MVVTDNLLGNKSWFYLSRWNVNKCKWVESFTSLKKFLKKYSFGFFSLTVFLEPLLVGMKEIFLEDLKWLLLRKAVYITFPIADMAVSNGGEWILQIKVSRAHFPENSKCRHALNLLKFQRHIFQKSRKFGNVPWFTNHLGNHCFFFFQYLSSVLDFPFSLAVYPMGTLLSELRWKPNVAAQIWNCIFKRHQCSTFHAFSSLQVSLEPWL